MIDIKYLEYMVVLSNVRSIHKASEILYISQPALSNALKKFERQLGVTLFDRSSCGVEPTAFCELLLPLAREILDNVDTFAQKCAQYSLIQKYNIEKTTLILSAYPMLATAILPNILAALKIFFPQLNIVTKNLDMKKEVPEPDENEIIIAFESKNHVLFDNLDDLKKEVICPVKPVIFVHSDMVQDGSRYISEKAVSKSTLVTVLKEYPLASLITRSYINHLRKLNAELKIIDVSNGTTATALVKRKQGICMGIQIGLLIPRNFSYELVPLQLRDTNPETFSMVLICKDTLPAELLSLIRQVFQNEFIYNVI